MSRSVTMPRSLPPSATSRCRMRFWIMSCRASSTGVSGPVVIGFGVISSLTVMGPPLAALLHRIGSRHPRTHLLHVGVLLLHHAAHPLVHLTHLRHLAAHVLHLRLHLLHHLHHARHALVLRPGGRSLRRRRHRQRDQEHCRRETRDHALHGPYLPLTVRTGHVAAVTTRDATLPRNSLASPERP